MTYLYKIIQFFLDLIFYFNFAPQYKLIKFNKWQLTEHLP